MDIEINESINTKNTKNTENNFLYEITDIDIKRKLEGIKEIIIRIIRICDSIPFCVSYGFN